MVVGKGVCLILFTDLLIYRFTDDFMGGVQKGMAYYMGMVCSAICVLVKLNNALNV